MENRPLETPISMDNLTMNISEDMRKIVLNKCSVDLYNLNAVVNMNEFKNIVIVYKQVYNKIYSLNFTPSNVKPIILNAILENLFELWHRLNYNLEFFLQIKQVFSAAQIIALFSIYLNENNMGNILDFFFNNKDRVFSKNKPIKTIALYYYKVFNGGVEKFLSLIAPIYLNMGYNVVLITDEIDKKKEYALPSNKNFKRITIKTPYSNFLGRLEELTSYVDEYKIDLFFSQAYYGNFAPHLQILFFKLLGVPVLMEMHANFMMIAPFTYKVEKVFRLADGIITLSRTDKMFWQNFDCNTYYIPNPIHCKNKDGNELKPKINKKIILWVGRLTAIKQPMEIIPIMTEVVKHVPDAKLNILGEADPKEFDLDRFKFEIKKNSLENNIKLCGHSLDVNSYYKAANLVLMTSALEGFSFVVAETKINALPLVCYELPYLEFFREEKGYLSVPQNDTHAAAMSIVKILTDDDLRQKMSVESRESIQPFIDYDLLGAWKKVFNNVEAGIRYEEKNFEIQQVEKMLLQNIVSKNMQIRYMNQMLNSFKGELTKLKNEK